MSKPLLLGNEGKSDPLIGTASGQVPTWSDTAQTWVAGPGSNSGGGGRIYYLNENTAAASPTMNIPTSSNGLVTVKQLGTLADSTQTTVTTTTMSTNPASPTILAGFVTDTGDPDRTSVPAGLWEFNVWASASGPSIKPDEVLFRVGVYKYDGSTTPTLIANSDYVGIFNTTVTGQYTATVLIPAGVTLADTDRIYVQIDTYSTSANHDLTCYFGNGTPSHVHTTIPVLVNLATDVTGILPVANGGTGAGTLTGYVKGAGTATMTASATIPVADVTGAAPLASPTFSGTPSLPTGTTGVTQTANDGSTKLATTLYADTAASNAKGAPYDVAGEYIGKPPVSTVLMRFVSNRSWTLKSSLVRASCTAFPTGSNAVATISIAGSNLTSGTITWTTTSTVTIGSFTDTTITAGQAVVLTLTTADSGTTFENPFFTLGGVVA